MLIRRDGGRTNRQGSASGQAGVQSSSSGQAAVAVGRAGRAAEEWQGSCAEWAGHGSSGRAVKDRSGSAAVAAVEGQQWQGRVVNRLQLGRHRVATGSPLSRH